MGETSKVFVRDATGLVRSLGFFDQFIISQSIILIINGFVPTVLFAPYFFPGANLALVFALGTIPAVAMASVYSALSAAIPRSGGDYVWSTRILGPYFGSLQFVFLFVTTMVLGATLSNYFAVTIGLSQLAFTLGVTTHNVSLVALSSSMSQPSVGYPVSLLLYLFTTLVALFGLKTFTAFQRVGTILFLIINLVFVILLLQVNPATIPSRFNHAMQFAGSNATYSGIIQQATSGGFVSTKFNLSNTLLAAIPWGFLTYTNFNYGAYLAGETRNARSSISRALFLSVFLTAVALMTMSLLAYNDFGSSFLGSASYVEATNPSALPTLPTTSMLVSLSSPIAAAAVGFGIFIGYVVGILALFVTLSRMFFAASFDRLLPARFADVNERFHSPQWAVIVIGILFSVWITIFWFAGFAASYLNASIVSPTGYMLPLIAAALFPIAKPDLFRRTVGSLGTAGKMAIYVGAPVGAAAFAIYMIAETFPIISGVFLGASLAVAYSTLVALILVATAIFATSRYRMHQLGIDMNNVYKEIPPE